MSKSARAGSVLVFSLGLLVPPASAGNVIVVDSAGTGDYFRIQRAVDVALDGDTVLVKSGTYPGFSIDDKRVNVVAHNGHTVRILGTVKVTNLAASRDVILGGLDVEGAGYGFEIRNAAGSVRVQDCTALAADGWVEQWHGALVDACEDLAFVRCELTGGRDIYFSGSGILATDSRIALQDCTLRGGDGLDADCDDNVHGGNGGSGATASGSFLFASGTSFQGGDGGNAVPFCETSGDGGFGGTGLAIFGLGAEGDVLGCTFSGGVGGNMGCGPFMCGEQGSPGQTTWAANGAVLNILPGTARSLLAPTVVRENSHEAPLSISGETNDALILMVSPHASFAFVPNQLGVRLLPTTPPPTLHILMTIFSGTTLDTVLPAFTLGDGVECRTYFLQAQHKLPNGQRRLGGSGGLIVLDSAF